MAKSEDEGVVLKLLIVGLVEVASGALVYVAATAVEDFVVLGHTRCLFSSAGAAAASDTAHFTTLARLIGRGSVWRSYRWFDPRLLWAGGGFACTRLRRSQDVYLKLSREMKFTGVQFRLRDSQIIADLLQREWVRIR